MTIEKIQEAPEEQGTKLPEEISAKIDDVVAERDALLVLSNQFGSEKVEGTGVPKDELVKTIVTDVSKDPKSLLLNNELFSEQVEEEKLHKENPVLNKLKQYDLFKDCENFWDVTKILSEKSRKFPKEYIAAQAFIGGTILLVAGGVNPIARLVFGAPLLRWGYRNSSLLQRFFTQEDIDRIAGHNPNRNQNQRNNNRDRR
jgi:hypothetical protein